MCIAGLRAAIKLSGQKRSWVRTEKQMSAAFKKVYSHSEELIPRTYCAGRATQREDLQPDTSLLGLVWPSGILNPLDEKMKATVAKIIEANTVAGGGLLRYPGDVYCGGVREGWVTLTGAGAWPLLSFWMSVYSCLCGDRGNAERHFDWPLEKIDNHLPEQIFADKSKSSVSALLWSHAMFVIAARFLGHI